MKTYNQIEVLTLVITIAASVGKLAQENATLQQFIREFSNGGADDPKNDDFCIFIAKLLESTEAEIKKNPALVETIAKWK